MDFLMRKKYRRKSMEKVQKLQRAKFYLETRDDMKKIYSDDRILIYQKVN